MKLRLALLLSFLCFLPVLCSAQQGGGVQSINGVPGPFTFGSGSTCVGTTCTFSGGGGGLPTATAAGQIYASTSSGTTAAVQPSDVYWNSGDTIASINANTLCAIACVYHLTGSVAVTATATLNASVAVVASGGGTFNVSSGQTLTFGGNFSSPDFKQHFSGSGSVAFSQLQAFDYPEWFGAVGYTTFAAANIGTDSTTSFQAAASALQIGSVRTLGMFYRTTGVVNFSKSHVGMVGPEVTRGGQMEIVDTSATGNILNASGAALAVFKYFTLARSVPDTGADSGFYALQTGCMLVQAVHSSDSLYPFRSNQTPSCGNSGGFYNDTAEWCDNGVTAPTGTPVGFLLESPTGLPEDSITLRDDGVSNHCGSNIGAIGWEDIGTSVNDVDVFNMNTAGTNIGHVINYTGTGTAPDSCADIHVKDETDDSWYTGGGLIENMPNGCTASVEETGGYEFGNNVASYAIEVLNSSGVTIVAKQLGTIAGSSVGEGVLFSGATNSSATGNVILNATIGIEGISNSNVNTFTANAIRSASQGIKLTTNSNNNTITGNTCSSFISSLTCLDFESGSTGNNYNSNMYDSSITTPVTDSSGGVNANYVYSYPYYISNTTSAAHVPIMTNYAPNATYGSGCLAYTIRGVAATTNNSVQTVFGCIGAGSASNWYGWTFLGSGIYNSQIFPNGSTEFGETTPAVGPANGIAVGTTGQATIDGSGNGTFTKVNVASARKGTFVCTAGGTITIANTNELVTSDVIISLNTAGGTISTSPAMKTVTAGTGFTVLCGAADTSTYNYDILN